MKRNTHLVLIGMVISVLLGGSLVGTRPGQAAHLVFSCETELFDDFNAADATYSSTFRSWYRGLPVSCDTECVPTCFGLSGSALDTCMNNCRNSCNSSRFSAFQTAQEGLLDVAGRNCPINLNQCAAAQDRQASCVSTYNFHIANPMLDGNGNYDLTWLSMVFEEYSSCNAASGIDNCQ